MILLEPVHEMLHRHGPRAVLCLEQGLTILLIFFYLFTSLCSYCVHGVCHKLLNFRPIVSHRIAAALLRILCEMMRTKRRYNRYNGGNAEVKDQPVMGAVRSAARCSRLVSLRLTSKSTRSTRSPASSPTSVTIPRCSL